MLINVNNVYFTYLAVKQGFIFFLNLLQYCDGFECL